MSVCWPLCAGVWYLRGSRRMTQARCNTAPTTAAVRVCWRRNLTRCTLRSIIFSLFCFYVCPCVLLLNTVHIVSPSQDPLLKGQRCVILADGFYEWRRQEKDKQPFFIYFPQTQGPSQRKTSDQCDFMTPALNEENSDRACPPEGASADLTEVSARISIFNKSTSEHLLPAFFV